MSGKRAAPNRAGPGGAHPRGEADPRGGACPPPGDDWAIRENARLGRELLAAREDARLLKAILEGIKAATFTIDAHTFAILDMNRVAGDLFAVAREDWIGRPYGELLGRNLVGLNHAGAPITLSRDGLDAEAGGEFLLNRPDGRLVPISRTVLTGKALGGKYIFEVLFDISAKKAMERQLGLAQKLESIGQLASGIAHEINTPIQYVSGNLGFLQEAFKEFAGLLTLYEQLLAAPHCTEENLAAVAEARRKARLDVLMREIPDSIEDSIAGVERVAGIVGAMKRFSHPESGVKRLVDVNKAVESTLTITRNEWKYVADVRTELDPSLPHLLCFPGDFNQALLNVVVNAAHAVAEKVQAGGGKGAITVSTFREDGWLAVRVTDSGVGIPRENIDKIFDPFFTTKEVGKGTGQGLAIVHSVVNQHGGTIAIDSAPGEGTAFTLRFPVPVGAAP